MRKGCHFLAFPAVDVRYPLHTAGRASRGTDDPPHNGISEYAIVDWSSAPPVLGKRLHLSDGDNTDTQQRDQIHAQGQEF